MTKTESKMATLKCKNLIYIIYLKYEYSTTLNILNIHYISM